MKISDDFLIEPRKKCAIAAAIAAATAAKISPTLFVASGAIFTYSIFTTVRVTQMYRVGANARTAAIFATASI